MSIYRLDSSNHFHCINGYNFILRIMKTEQVLSIEQMKHLQELGLDTSDASIYWARVSHGSRIDDKSKGKWFMSLQKEFQTCGFISYETLPAYTLQDILNKLPESIQIYDLYIFKKVGLWWLKYVDVTNNGTVRLEKMPKLIDAAYYMLCWCIQKGFVKTNKEVKDGRKEN
nr:MAG TPA: hypothetical protein [Bacteriophage sp.]